MKNNKARFEIPKRGKDVEKEAPEGLQEEDKRRHIVDNRKGREGFFLCGCKRNLNSGRKPLNPKVSDDLDALIEKFRGCQRCLYIWIKRFL